MGLHQWQAFSPKTEQILPMNHPKQDHWVPLPGVRHWYGWCQCKYHHSLKHPEGNQTRAWPKRPRKRCGACCSENKGSWRNETAMPEKTSAKTY
jgi:hypothetical protein